MLIDFVVFPWYSLPLFALCFVLNWFLFVKPACTSFFDPLNFGMNLTNSGTLTVYLAMKLEGSLQGWEGIHVPLFTLAVMVTTRIVGQLPLRAQLETLGRFFGDGMQRNTRLHWISSIVFFLLIVAVFVSKFGLPILYANPLDSRLMYSDGDGSIRRVLQAASLFAQLASVVMYVRYRSRAGLFAFFGIALVSAAILVSKSALVGQMIFLIFALNVYGEYRLNKFVIPLLPIGILFSLWVIYAALRTRIPGVGFEQVLGAFATRVIAFGDASFYALDTPKIVEAFRKDDLFDLIRTNLSSFLASFRLMSWDDALSTGGRIYAVIVGRYNGVGPNATVQIEGWLYLGWLGILYCILTAMAVTLLRRISLVAFRSGDVFTVNMGATVFFGVTQVFADGSFWGTLLVSLVFALGVSFGVYGIYVTLRILLCNVAKFEKIFAVRYT